MGPDCQGDGRFDGVSIAWAGEGPECMTLVMAALR